MTDYGPTTTRIDAQREVDNREWNFSRACKALTLARNAYKRSRTPDRAGRLIAAEKAHETATANFRKAQDDLVRAINAEEKAAKAATKAAKPTQLAIEF